MWVAVFPWLFRGDHLQIETETPGRSQAFHEGLEHAERGAMLAVEFFREKPVAVVIRLQGHAVL